VLFLAVPLDQVDVNVHPQKSEVRFATPRAAYEAISSSVTRALRPAPWLGASSAPLRAFDPEAWGRAALLGEAEAGWAPARSSAAAASETEPDSTDRPDSGAGTGTADWSAASAGAVATDRPGATAFTDIAARTLLGPVGYFDSLRYLGQIADTYLVCEGPEGALVVLDQHAAHERVLFEELRVARRGHTLSSQRLLVPAVIELGPVHAAAMAAHRDQLLALGFEVEPFGGESFSVATVPAVLSRAKLVPLLTDLAEQLAHVESTDAAQDAENDVLATMACHAAIRAGDRIGVEEVRSLFRSLDSIDFKVRCPHGRPVVTTLSLAELERRVDRR
jgi:DNA mismatch repair protein MutL